MLLDIARLHGVDHFDDGYAITGDDLDAAASAAGVTVEPGDAVLVRTGHMAFLPDDRQRYNHPSPGLSTKSIEWIHDHDVAAVATDTLVFEVWPGEDPKVLLPVHMIHLRDLGLLQGQNWYLDELAADCASDGRWAFLLVASPLPLTRSVGGPVAPGRAQVAPDSARLRPVSAARHRGAVVDLIVRWPGRIRPRAQGRRHAGTAIGRAGQPLAAAALLLAGCFHLERSSVSSTGGEGNGPSTGASISGDGRFVAFESTADNLVARRHQRVSDIFVRDRRTHTTTLVSVSATGGVADGPSTSASISDDGRYVAFDSTATNLVDGDVDARSDVFVRDLQTGTTTRLSPDHVDGLFGSPSPSPVSSVRPRISGDGRYVAFREDTAIEGIPIRSASS